MRGKWLFRLTTAACLWLMINTCVWGNGEYAKWVIEGAPQSYIVKEGDTLWDIACKFLHDPWRWEQIWETNSEIENPDLIFPGDRIVLFFIGEKPCLRVVRGEYSESNNLRTGIVKLSPRIRSLPADRAIPTIPLDVIGPFLNASEVVSAEQIELSPKVMALDEDHIVVGAGDFIYVCNLSEVNKNIVYSVFRPGKRYLDPRTKECLGIEGDVLGRAQLKVPGEPARMIVTQSFAEVKIGDRLLGMPQEQIAPFFIPKYPKEEGDGQIISVFGGLNQIGQYQVVAITGGRNCLRERGDVLAVFQTKKDIPSRFTFSRHQPIHFPPMRIGTLMVFRVFDKVSYALVMHATRPINLLEEVGRP